MDPRTDQYLALLLAWNRGAGLTAFRNAEEADARGVRPSLQALPLLPESGAVLDVGSGGGFPALPLALARPGLRFTCCEPRPRKAAFLREAGRVLRLDLTVWEASVEEALRGCSASFSAVTVRGVRLRRPLLRGLRGALVPGGALLVWTGGETLGEYRQALHGLGFEGVEERPLVDGSVLLSGNVPRGTPEG